jgi:hypothetical protein
MLEATTVFNVLEKNFPSIRPHLGLRWAEFSRGVENLADQFKAIADEDDPERALCYLEAAVNDLIKVCRGFPYVAELLDQAEGVPLEPGSESEGSKRPLPSQTPNIVEVKGITNRYYSLLARLKKTADQKERRADDRRTRA